MQHAFRILRDLRNSVHNEALDLTRADGVFYLTTEAQTEGKLRTSYANATRVDDHDPRRQGSAPGWRHSK